MTRVEIEQALARLRAAPIGSLNHVQAIGLFNSMRVHAFGPDRYLVHAVCVRILVLGRLKISNVPGYITRDWTRDHFEFAAIG